MREKLIELIASKVCDIYAEYCEEWIEHDCVACYSKNCLIAESADHLIANGVTIPVRCKECFYHHYICPTGFDDRQDDDYCSQGVRDNPWPMKEG